jgi:hypothetical protein
MSLMMSALVPTPLAGDLLHLLQDIIELQSLALKKKVEDDHEASE